MIILFRLDGASSVQTPVYWWVLCWLGLSCLSLLEPHEVANQAKASSGSVTSVSTTFYWPLVAANFNFRFPTGIFVQLIDADVD